MADGSDRAAGRNPYGAPGTRLRTGDRVVVRYRRAGVAPGEPALSDALGDVVATGPDGITVRTRRGDVVVPAEAVVAAKRVPPPPPRGRTDAREPGREDAGEPGRTDAREPVREDAGEPGRERGVGQDVPVDDLSVDLAGRLAALQERCRTTPGVTSLVVFGSSTTNGAGRRDAWSDLDFNVFLAPAAAPELTRTWAFLPDREHLVLTAREGANGGVAMYDDGVLCEFGAGLPWTIQDTDREVLLDGGDLALGRPDPLPDPADQVGLFLAKLAIGVGRVRRGERVSGNVQVRAYALTCLCETLRQRLAPDAARSPFDPLRRLEGALPDVAQRIAVLLDAEAEQCARGLFDLARELLEPGWADFPRRAADVVAARLGWTNGGSLHGS